MKKYIHVISSLFFLFITSCLSKPMENPRWILYEDLTYSQGEGWSLELDLAVPDNSMTNFPLIVYFYSSGFKWGDKKGSHFLIEEAVAHGYAIALVNYRGTPDFHYPSQYIDGKNAVKWLRYHAADFNINPERIAARGTCSGGKIAMILGLTEPSDGFEGNGEYRDVSSRVSAVVNHAGLGDFVYIGEWPYHLAFLGSSLNDNEELYRKASPVNYMKGQNAPILTTYGLQDNVVDLDWLLHTAKVFSIGKCDHTLVIDPMLGHNPTDAEIVWLFLDEYLK